MAEVDEVVQRAWRLVHGSYEDGFRDGLERAAKWHEARAKARERVEAASSEQSIPAPTFFFSRGATADIFDAAEIRRLMGDSDALDRK